MANNEIHNYVNEQTTPTEGDFMDLDADQGGGNYLSKKMTLSNLRKWLFKWVNQDTLYLLINNLTFQLQIKDNSFNVSILDIEGDLQFITGTPSNNYANSFTQVYHIYNINGTDITFSNDFLTTAENPPITTTVGGYSQVWVTYHKKPDNSEIWTANTINFI